MRTIFASRLPIVLLAAFVALPAATAVAKPGGTITGKGRIGPLKLEESTRGDVRRAFGRPDDRRSEKDGNGEPSAVAWYWGCTDDVGLCETSIGFSAFNGWTMDGFVTTSSKFRTRRGTRPGTARDRAIAREDLIVQEIACRPPREGMQRNRLEIVFDPAGERVEILGFYSPIVGPYC